MRARVRMFAALASLGCVSAAHAQGLAAEYCVEQISPGFYQYTFTISTDAGWAPGMGWAWLIFGDEPGTGLGGTGIEPMPDFVVDPASFPVGPWEKIQGTGGGHNGRTFAKLNGAVLDPWMPASASETLTWTGTSSFLVPTGGMLISTLSATGGAAPASFLVATEVSCGTCYADCDGSGSLNIFDYICFGNEYAAGCP